LARLIFLVISSGGSSRVIRDPSLGSLAHLAAPVREAHHPGPLRQDQGLGHPQDRHALTGSIPGCEAGVDALLGDVARQLQMLLLVFPHGHPIGVVEENVGSHQHRVIEQPGGDIRPLLHRFLLELNHPLQPVERRDAVQQPAELAVGWYVALHKDRGALGIDAAGQIQGRRGEGVLRQPRRIVGHGDGMQIHDAEERVMAVLQLHPVADRPQPVAQVQGSGGLNP
jgi:hypothetical protein